jgi:hypothetical protein
VSALRVRWTKWTLWTRWTLNPRAASAIQHLALSTQHFPSLGVTGFEPVTLRLSSACSNQLSYTPFGWVSLCVSSRSAASPLRFVPIAPWTFVPVAPWTSHKASNRKASNPLSALHQWRHGDSNPRPIACKATALPTELCPRVFEILHPLRLFMGFPWLRVFPGS